jgi:predicted metal-binding membrane protein
MTLNRPAESLKARIPPNHAPTLFETVLMHDRVVVVSALIVIIAAAWIWIALGAGTDMTAAMNDMQGQMPAGMVMNTMMPVVDHDGRHDAAERHANAAAIRSRQSKGKSGRAALRANSDICDRLYDDLGRV